MLSKSTKLLTRTVGVAIVCKLLLIMFGKNEHLTMSNMAHYLESYNQKTSSSFAHRKSISSSDDVGPEAVSHWIVGNLTQKGLVRGTRELLEPSLQFADPRTAWALAATPWFCYWCSMLYFSICLASPLYFRHTKPVKETIVRPFVAALNLVLCAMYAYVSYEFIVNIWHSGYDFLCSPPAPESRNFTTVEYRLARACYWYYVSKFLRMLDTVVFIARHKRHSVNTFHVLHHGLMPALSFILVRFYPGGHTLFHPMVHSTVHTLLYLYFLLASMGPKYRRFLFWKKWLTQIQLAHFFVMLGHELLSQAIGCHIWKAYLYDMMYTVFGLMIVKYVYVYAVSYVIPATSSLVVVRRTENAKTAESIDSQ